MANNSFIENLNTVANATKLATGDVVEDSQLARNEAVAAAISSKGSELSALDSKNLANEWANKGHNNPVTGSPGIDAKFSAYHWSVEAENTIGDPLINDNILSANYTWSSTKISSELYNKSNSDHNHDTIYEPRIYPKQSAFNVPFGGLSGEYGVSNSVARTDHTHDSAYEPRLSSHGTGFNKDFGTTAGTVAEGSHKHDDRYMPIEQINTAYNKNFVADVNAPLANEVPRGTHGHRASGIAYDNSGNIVVSSTTAQGALQQLDARLGTISVAEKCKIVAGMTDEEYVASISTVGVPVEINAGMTLGDDTKNAVYSNGVKIAYPEDPSKLVEGQYAATVSIEVLANKFYKLHVIKNGVPAASYNVELGSSTKNLEGAFSTTISGWVSGLSNGDTIGIGVSNETDDTDVKIYSLNISFAGEPEGALVMSGATVLHDEILGKDAPDQHPTTSIYDPNSSVALDVILEQKASKVTSATDNNLIAMDSVGDIKDSGITINEVINKVDNIASPVLDHLLAMESDGSLKDSGSKIIDLARKNGSDTEAFKVKDGANANEAASVGQMNALGNTKVSDTDFDAHKNAVNPHGTGYADVGAAPLLHTHTQSQVVGLTDSLNSKYTKTTTPITNNIPMYSSSNELMDSGISLSGGLLTGEAV